MFKSRPNRVLKLDLWCDSDFAGLHGYEDPEDQSLACPHTGFVVTLGDLPVVWSSKLQTETALSTAKAKYAALCSGM